MILLDGASLTIEDVVAVAEGREHVRIAGDALDRMQRSRDRVEGAMRGTTPVYALNTGVGLLANIRLEDHEIEVMQVNLIRSHCCGVGEPLPTAVVRGMMLIRANVLAKGLSGIRAVVAERICDLLNCGITPVVPSRGSVGASGDLAPLAHMALVLIGEGRAEYRGEVLDAAVCMERAGLEPLKLQGKEGISLLNGTQAMLSIGCLRLQELEDLFYTAQTTAALSIEALRGTAAAFDARLHAARPHAGQMLSARHLLELLEGSTIPRTHGEGSRIQDAYCLRCIPQVHGAAWDTMQFARGVFEIELNSATDNPLVFEDAIVSGGNFHGAPLALALDYLAIAVCQLAGISERRTERLMNPSLNEGLPAFLASQPGIESGMMMAQVTAAALVAEMRVLASPASTGSIPTSGNQEDFVSMGMTSGLKLEQSAGLARMVIAIELLAAVRAMDLRGDTSTPVLEEARSRFRMRVPAWREDCVLSVWMEEAAKFLADDGWRDQSAGQVAVEEAVR
jgi:histidine ammonia-lyase